MITEGPIADYVVLEDNKIFTKQFWSGLGTVSTNGPGPDTTNKVLIRIAIANLEATHKHFINELKLQLNRNNNLLVELVKCKILNIKNAGKRKSLETATIEIEKWENIVVDLQERLKRIL